VANQDTSPLRVIAQGSQHILNGRFSQFNYGLVKNRLVYNQSIAPEIPLGNITSKYIYLVYGRNDLAADYQDVMKLIWNLKCMIIDKSSLNFY
jgi:hypothetical protein